MELRPGEDKTLHITGLDQFNNPTYFVARVIDENQSLRARLSSLFTITNDFNPPADYSEVYMGKVHVGTCTHRGRNKLKVGGGLRYYLFTSIGV